MFNTSKISADSLSKNKNLFFDTSILPTNHLKEYRLFGATMPGRSFNGNIYKYGFNGKLKDDEIKGEGNSYDFGARIYDSRLGRWLSTDPLQSKYPSLSPYNFCANNPIYYVDPDGKRIVVHYEDAEGKMQKIVIRKASDIEKLNYEGAGDFAKAVYSTFKYMENDDDFQSSIQKLRRLQVIETTGGDTKYSAGYWSESGYFVPHTLYYDPYTIVHNKDNDGNELAEYNSNASGLYHELGHFLSRLKLGAKKHIAESGINKDGMQVNDGTRYHNAQEKRIITGPERDFNKRHGEPIRDNHYGRASKTEKTSDPTENSNSDKGGQSPRYLED
jgi:RHS repeat-associated protein